MSALSEGRRPPVDRSEGARFDGYAALAAYARAADCTPPDYAAFDRATVSHINLFSMRDNFDFARLSRILDEMLRALPAAGVCLTDHSSEGRAGDPAGRVGAGGEQPLHPARFRTQ